MAQAKHCRTCTCPTDETPYLYESADQVMERIDAIAAGKSPALTPEQVCQVADEVRQLLRADERRGRVI